MYANQCIEQISGSVYDGAATTAKNEVGRRAAFGDGRVFYYARTTNDISYGDLVVATQNVQEVTAAEFDAPAAGSGGAIGDTKINVSGLTSGVSVNEYAGGYVLVATGTGEGQMFRVKRNTVAGASGFDIYLWDGITTALDTTSALVLINGPFWNVKTHTAANYGGTPTEICVGKAMAASTASSDSNTQYIWVQTWGLAAVQVGTATGIAGGPVQLAEDDNGSGQIPVATENRIQTIGVVYAGMTDATPTVIDDTKWGYVFLQILP